MELWDGSQWIGAMDGALCFRALRRFELSAIPQTAILAVTADCYYIAYLNGEKLGVGPVRGTRTRQYFDRYDVRERLREGENILAFEVMHLPVATFVVDAVIPALRAEIPGVVATDGQWQALAALDWRTDVPFFTMQSGIMEYRDLRLTPNGWLEGRGTDAWPRAKPVSDSVLTAKTLTPRGIPPLRRRMIPWVDVPAIAAVPPGDAATLAELPGRLNSEVWSAADDRVTLTPETGGFALQPVPDGAGIALILEFPEELIGRLEVEVEAPDGTVIDVVYGEELWQGRLRADFENSIYYFTDRYILREGRNRIGTTFWDHGFKVVQLVVRNFEKPVVLRRIQAQDERYPWVRYGAFHSSDTVLNGIWEMCVQTLECCTTDVFLDCPWRERAFWVNDLLVENRTSLAAFGATAVHRRALELAFAQQREDGMIPAVAPSPDKGAEERVLPATNLFMALVLRDYLLCSGDVKTVKLYLEPMRRILAAFARFRDAEGVIRLPEAYYHFYDWSFELNGYSCWHGCDSMIHSLHVMALEAFAWVARECGETPEPLIDAIPARFVDPETGRLTERVRRGEEEVTLTTQLGHALGLLASGANANWLEALLDEKLLAPDYYLHTFVLQALRQAGRENEALARIRRYWGKCLATGYGTLFEAGVGQFGREAMFQCGSLCHGFGTAPVEFFQNTLLGVEPLAPGFRRFRVAPRPCDLEFASGRIPTPAGNIRVAWRRTAEGLELELRFPPALTAVLPDGREITGGHLICTLSE